MDRETILATARDFLMNRLTDPEGFGRLLTEDVTYHVLGHNALAGSFVGREAAVEHIAEVARQTGHTFTSFKWDDWMVGDYHVGTIATAHAQVGGRHYVGTQLFILRFDMDGRIAGVTVYFEDEDKIDRFVGP